MLARYVMITFEEFVANKKATETPGRKGWAQRRLPHWRAEYRRKRDYAQRAESLRLAEEREAYEASPEGIEARKVWETRRRAKEQKYAIPLASGESLIFNGHLLRSSSISGPAWVGDRYYSHSEGCWADYFFVPSGVEISVEIISAGDPLSFARAKVTRVV